MSPDIAGELVRLRAQDVAAGSAQCRVCGCTTHYGCPSGCWWVESDLCSSCAGGLHDFLGPRWPELCLFVGGLLGVVAIVWSLA